MMQIVLIGLAAGCASALLFASIASGSLLSVLLFYLAPLPIMIAALGWGPLAALIGGIGAATGLGAIFGLPIFIAFVVMMALPAWWLGYLALLGRPLPMPDPVTARHRPRPSWNGIRSAASCSGSLVLARCPPSATLLTLGTDAATITETAAQRPCCAFSVPRTAASGRRDPATDRCRIDDPAPAAAATSALTMLILNLWLAARIAATSGRLRRPWPDLKSTELPPMTLAALSAAIAFCFSGGLLAMLAQTVTAALLMAYALSASRCCTR